MLESIQNFEGDNQDLDFRLMSKKFGNNSNLLNFLIFLVGISKVSNKKFFCPTFATVVN